MLKVMPAENGHEPEQRQEPHYRYHDESAALRASADVLQRCRHRPVAVEAADRYGSVLCCLITRIIGFSKK